MSNPYDFYRFQHNTVGLRIIIYQSSTTIFHHSIVVYINLAIFLCICHYLSVKYVYEVYFATEGISVKSLSVCTIFNYSNKDKILQIASLSDKIVKQIKRRWT